MRSNEDLWRLGFVSAGDILEELAEVRVTGVHRGFGFRGLDYFIHTADYGFFVIVEFGFTLLLVLGVCSGVSRCSLLPTILVVLGLV